MFPSQVKLNRLNILSQVKTLIFFLLTIFLISGDVFLFPSSSLHHVLLSYSLTSIVLLPRHHQTHSSCFCFSSLSPLHNVTVLPHLHHASLSSWHGPSFRFFVAGINSIGLFSFLNYLSLSLSTLLFLGASRQ